MTLRPYQQEAIEKLLASLNHGKNPVCAVATGGGKSVLIAELCNRLDGRILVVTHRKELIQQNEKTFHHINMGNDSIGVYSSGLARREISARVIFAGVASIYKRMEELQRAGNFKYILWDEVHHGVSGRDGNTMGDQILQGCPTAKRVGFSATPYRLPDIPMWGSDSSWFDEIGYEASILDLTNQGYLARLVGVQTASAPNLSHVRTRGGDFALGDLSQASSEEEVVNGACDEILYLAQDRQHILIFCVDRAHAAVVAEALRERGCAPEVVLGNTPNVERSTLLDRFKAGEIRYLISVNTINTGFDAPNVDCVVMLRATQSKSLLVQAIGRGCRLHPDKDNCIAEGQLVLTDRGLIPIENVPLDCRVWDGIEWVSHDGPIYRGVQEVITYAGLTATRDHLVYTKEGWRAFGECAIEQIPIVQTGFAGDHIRLCDCDFARSDLEGWEAQASVSFLPVHELWAARVERLSYGDIKDYWMQDLYTPKGNREAIQEGYWDSELAVYEDHSGKILPGKRDRVPLCVCKRSMSMGKRASGTKGRLIFSSYRQEWPFRAWKSDVVPVFCFETETWVKYAPGMGEQRRVGGCDEFPDKSIPARIPTCEIWGCKNLISIGTRVEFRGGGGILRHGSSAKKRKVWDIVNSGPRHRFTVSGLLVHNCLILDAGDNLRRHAPLDGLPKVLRSPKLAEVEKVEREKRECADRERKPRHDAVVAKGIDPLATDVPDAEITLQITKATYSLRPAKKFPDRQNLLVSYRGVTPWGSERSVAQFVLLEYPGRPGVEAAAWFVRRGLEKPENPRRALAMAWNAPVPSEIVVRKNAGWDQVTMEHFDEH